MDMIGARVSDNGVVLRGERVIGWVRHAHDHGCDNPACLEAVDYGRPWHAIPEQGTLPLGSYHFASRRNAIAAIVRVAAFGVPVAS